MKQKTDVTKVFAPFWPKGKDADKLCTMSPDDLVKEVEWLRRRDVHLLFLAELASRVLEAKGGQKHRFYVGLSETVDLTHLEYLEGAFAKWSKFPPIPVFRALPNATAAFYLQPVLPGFKRLKAAMSKDSAEAQAEARAVWMEALENLAQVRHWEGVLGGVHLRALSAEARKKEGDKLEADDRATFSEMLALLSKIYQNTNDLKAGQARMEPKLDGVPPMVDQARDAMKNPIEVSAEMMRQADEKLSPKDRKFFQALVKHGYSVRAAAKEIGRPEKSVRNPGQELEHIKKFFQDCHTPFPVLRTGRKKTIPFGNAGKNRNGELMKDDATDRVLYRMGGNQSPRPPIGPP